jgi:hypothetical protein
VQLGVCEREKMNALLRQYDTEVVRRVAPTATAVPA